MYVRTVGIKKVPIYRPYNRTGNTVPFPFIFHAVIVLVCFQNVPVLSQGQPVRPSERPGRRNLTRLVINSAGRLAAVRMIVTELERELPSTVIEQQKESWQFSVHMVGGIAPRS